MLRKEGLGGSRHSGSQRRREGPRSLVVETASGQGLE